jgi:RND family efflux transporter MFP subunit
MTTRSLDSWSRLPLSLALAALLSACTATVAGEAAAPALPSVPVAAPLQQTIPITLDVPGHVEAAERVELRPRVGGYVKAVTFAEGARVRKGDLLVQIDPAPYAAALAAARAELQRADAQYRLASQEGERASRLVARQALSAEESERRHAQVAIARAARAAAVAAVERAQLDLDDARILAPIDGRIGRAEITMGNLVGPQDRLAVLVGDTRMYVRFDLPEAALGAASTRDWTARFSVPDAADLVFEGPLAFLENEIGAGTGTLRARMELPGHEALVPGRYGFVRLTMGMREDALLIDERAIGAEQGTRYVLVVAADGTVQYRPVTLGARLNGLRVIEQGLSAQDQVIVEGLMAVRPGMNVAPRPATPPADAADPSRIASTES